MLKKIILDGQIPYLLPLKKVLFWLALILPLYIFVEPREFSEFGEIGWNILIAVLLIRPLADIFPDLKILRTFSMLRKEFGIFAALLLIAHFVGFLMMREISIWDGLFKPENWETAACGWGLVGIIFVIPVLLTSNKFSMVLLKRKWKYVQHFTYLFFIFGGIHLALMGEGGIDAIGIVLAAWLAAKLGFKIKIPQIQ